MSILLDVLLCAGGEVAELLLMPFFTVACGFLFFGWPMAYGHGGIVRSIILMAITAVTDIVAVVELILSVIDSVAGTRSRSASIGKAYVQVGSRGNASADTRSDSCRDHAPAPAGASKADGRSSLYADATVHTPAQTRWLERPVDHESHVIGIHPYRNQNRLAGSDDMNVRRFHGGAVDSVVLDGNDCSFSTINSERHVESIAVPVVENAEKPIRGTTAVMRRPRFQSMHEHALHDIVIVKDEPSCLPPVAVRPPHAHDSGYDGDDRRRPSRPITNSNGRKHENDSKENLMNNEIRKFDFRGAALRTLTDEAGEPWFVAKDTQIKMLEPKARFADAVAASDGTCLVGELAKMLRQNGMDIGQNRLFRLLQADGYLGKSGSNRNVPTQRAMDLGLFRIKETTVTHADGHTTVSRTPKVTGKGQRYFIDRYWGRTQPSLEAGA